jgi:N-acetylmuramoyl-L-alanine amidase
LLVYINRTIILLLMSLLSGNLMATEVSGIRFWQDPEKTRLVFDVNQAVDYKLFSLASPHRLVIDINQGTLKTDLDQVEIPQQLVKNIRASQQADKLRIVIDLEQEIKSNHFALKPFQNFGHRLVVDLQDKAAKKSVFKTVKTFPKNENRDILIAIDAGHGGEDPGASGPRKTREKAITLKVAKRLANAINAEKGMRAILTRTGDYFVDLRKRTDIARENKVDLFVSIHADGFTDKRVKGASVWVLSPKGASSEMGRWLEQKEQASDLAGGVDLSHKDPLVAQVLLDLSMHYSVGASINAAENVRQRLVKVMPKMHGKGLRKAGFVVLKMPDIPSMLVETGFISNPTEEKLLKTASYQKKITKAVLDGIKSYFQSNPPDGSYYAMRNRSRAYQVKSGDTLSQIASNYGISTDKLKQHNRLKSNGLRIGQKLIIPEA